MKKVSTMAIYVMDSMLSHFFRCCIFFLFLFV